MDLSSLNFDSIQNIISSLSDEDISSLSEMAGELFGGNKKEREEKTEKQDDFNAQNIFSGIDMKTITKIMNILSKLNEKQNDPKENLVHSLKPLLSENRRHKADEVINIMKILSLLPYLKELQ